MDGSLDQTKRRLTQFIFTVTGAWAELGKRNEVIRNLTEKVKILCKYYKYVTVFLRMVHVLLTTVLHDKSSVHLFREI